MRIICPVWDMKPAPIQEYLKDRVNVLATNSKNKNVWFLCRGMNVFERGYQPRNNLVMNENGDHLADSHSVLNRCRNYFCQLLNVDNVSDARQTEIPGIQSTGLLDTDFTVSSFPQKWWVTCWEKCLRAFEASSTHCLLLLFIINQIQ
jgi:hypothetical protein